MRLASSGSALLLAALFVTSTRADDLAERHARAVRWLVSQQHENGGFGEIPGEYEGELGITSMVVKALADVRGPLAQEVRPAIDKAARFLLGFQQDDGSFVQGRSGLPTYRTAVVIMALVSADRDKHAEAIARAAKWLRGAQNDEDDAIKPEDVRYGGFSYGPPREGRAPGADLSNTQMALAALREAGIEEDDPVFQRAVAFLRRCQHDSEANDGAGFKPADDGGFVYDPVPRKDGAAPVSYAGMTYAGLLSLAYAGVSKDDPSVRAALGWIANNYTLEENKGLGRSGAKESAQAGLFYYYYTFAKCLAQLGTPTVETARGARPWAKDLLDALARRQRDDGSFVNSQDGTWWESNPVLVTAYCVTAMNYARPFLEAR